MENRFNLIDEPWIPVADHGRVSLRDIFTHAEYRALGGNPVQKIALLKLLLAIAQAAATPKDEAEWKSLGAEGLAQRCLAYLDKWHDRFYLYGEKPFLQMPSIVPLIKARTASRLSLAKTLSKTNEEEDKGKPKSLGAGFYPDFPSKNNTNLSHTMMDKELTDAEKAVFLITLMNFSFGGKRVESGMRSLGGDDMGAQYSAPASPSIGGKYGYLHVFISTDSIRRDIWINTLTVKDVFSLNRWGDGVGKAAWEAMPNSECDDISKSYKVTYMSTLISLSRFVLFVDDGAYYLDGIKYPKVSDGWYEPSLVLDNREHKAKYADPAKKPWRELDALLSFSLTDADSGFESFSLRKGIERCRDEIAQFSIFIGGLRVSENSGDQSVKQDDDFVESKVTLQSASLGKVWLSELKSEMSDLDNLAQTLWGKVVGYFKQLKADNGKKINNTHAGKMASKATHLFWQLCERDFQNLVDHCDQTEEAMKVRRNLRKRFAGYVHQAYDTYCPKDTARQLDAWAKCRPNNSKYLNQEA